MSNTTNFIFRGLQIVSWIIFIGLCIDAGRLIVGYFISLANPEMISSFFEETQLITLFQENRGVFIGLYSFVLAIAALKAYLFFIVVWLIQKLDLSRPFSPFVAKQISKLSRTAFTIGFTSLLGRQIAKNFSKYGYELEVLQKFWVDSQAFILMAAVIYLIAFIFKKGLEIQTENDLTV